MDVPPSTLSSSAVVADAANDSPVKSAAIPSGDVIAPAKPPPSTVEEASPVKATTESTPDSATEAAATEATPAPDTADGAVSIAKSTNGPAATAADDAKATPPTDTVAAVATAATDKTDDANEVVTISTDVSSESSEAALKVTEKSDVPAVAVAPPTTEKKVDAVIEVTDSDSLDADIDNMIVTETESDAVPQDDELMREMEEIEGTLETAKPAAADTPAVVSESPAKKVPESETSDLLKDLESGGDSAESAAAAAAAVVTAPSVDSTTEATPKSKHSDESPVKKPATVVATEAEAVEKTTVPAVAATEAEPMEVEEEVSSIETATAADKPDAAIIDDKQIDDSAVVSSTDDQSESTDEKKPSDSAADAETTVDPKPSVTEAPADDLDASVAKVTGNAEAATAAESLDRTLETPVPSQPAVENKLLTNMMNNGSSTPNSNPGSVAATPNVFNSTPIQRQFDISSENVSKIDGATTADNSTASAAHKSSHAGDALQSSTCSTGSETPEATQSSSSDNLTHYAKVLKQFNGLAGASDSTAGTPATSTEPSTTGAVAAVTTVTAADESATAVAAADSISQILGAGSLVVALPNGSNQLLDDTIEQHVRDSDYEICAWYDDSEMVYLNVERKPASSGNSTTTAPTSTTAATDVSSNGSVTSVGPFPLPGTTAAAAVAAAHSIGSSHSSSAAVGDSLKVTSVLLQQPPRVRHTVHGVVALADFMIEHFGKVRRQFGGAAEETAVTTPVAGRGRPAAKKNLAKAEATPSTPSRGAAAASAASARRGNKRTAASSAADETTEEEPSAKKAKSQKKEPVTPSSAAGDAADDTPFIGVMARWADKKYYAGRLKEAKANQKYVVVFEDGATKTLAQEVIVFGSDNGVLPLLDQYVHARVDGDTYEPGLVTQISSTPGETILYTVVAESQTVTVTSSDLYLEEDQAKVIQKATEANVPSAAAIAAVAAGGTAASAGDDSLLKSPISSSGKRAARPTAKFGEAAAAAASSRARVSGGKPKADAAAEPSTSAAAAAANSGRQAGRRNKRTAQASAAPVVYHPMLRSLSESSELSDTLDSTDLNGGATSAADTSALEEVDGVQPELQKTARDSELSQLSFQHEYLSSCDRTRTMEELLGPIPATASLFRNKYFLLTCTIRNKKTSTTQPRQNGDVNGTSAATTPPLETPFFKDHLRRQIEGGGGVVFEHFEDVPKTKYRFTKLVAAQPCATAKYVQCLAADIKAVSHEYIIECCRRQTLVDVRRYSLTAGWSLLRERLVRWTAGRAPDQRRTATPFAGTTVLIGSDSDEFVTFWTRVCRLAHATVRTVRSAPDIGASTRGYLLTDEEFSGEMKAKAEHFKIATVSTVWVVECLVAGELVPADGNEKFRKTYQDEFF